VCDKGILNDRHKNEEYINADCISPAFFKVVSVDVSCRNRNKDIGNLTAQVNILILECDLDRHRTPGHCPE